MKNIRSSFLEQPSILWLILFIAAFLRFHGLTAFSLSNDELSALSRLQFESIADVIEYGVYPDFHPAGIQLFLYFWTGLFGNSDLFVRIPFAILGVASVLIIYLLGKKLFGTNTGLLAAAALAGLQFPLLYSQIARPYSAGLFFVLSAAYFWSRILFRSNDKQAIKADASWYDLMLFVIFISLSMYTHYFSMLQAGLICIAGLFFVDKKLLPKYLAAGLVIALLYIPHLKIFLHHISKGGIGGEAGWLGPPESGFLDSYLRWTLNDSNTLLWVFIVMFFGYILLNKGKNHLKKIHIVVFLFFLLPFAIAYYYSIHVNPVLQYSILLFSFPFLLLTLFSFASTSDNIFENRFDRLPVMVLLIACVFSTINEYQYYQQAHFSEFRDLAKRSVEINSKYGEENVARVINIHAPYYIHHYLDDHDNRRSFDIYRIQTEIEKHNFYEFIDATQKPYLFFSWSNMYDDPIYSQVIQSKYYCLIDSANYLNSGFRLYSRVDSNNCLNFQDPLYHFYDGFESNDSKMIDSSIGYSGTTSLLMNEAREYGFLTEYKYLDVDEIQLGRIDIDLRGYAQEVPANVLLVVAYEIDRETEDWQSIGLRDFIFHGSKWQKAYMRYTIDQGLKKGGVFKIYIWNEKKENINIDDVNIKFYSSRL